MKFNDEQCFRFFTYLESAKARNEPSLSLSVEWIAANIPPEQVFTEEQLKQALGRLILTPTLFVRGKKIINPTELDIDNAFFGDENDPPR